MVFYVMVTCTVWVCYRLEFETLGAKKRKTRYVSMLLFVCILAILNNLRDRMIEKQSL